MEFVTGWVIKRRMKVLFLGAGASVRAGYPLASNLLSAVEVTAEQGHLGIRNAWKAWKTFRDRATGPLALALNHKNPEVVLSQIDLLVTAKGPLADHFKEGLTDPAFDKLFADEPVPDDYFKTPADKEIWPVTEARYRIIDCIEDFFRERHFIDSVAGNREHRDYLREYLSQLREGDLVITLNWDSTAERSLAELGEWNPFDGYGFKRRDLLLNSGISGQPLPDGCTEEKSTVKVLKMHGSVGWHLTEDRRIYFSNHYFLNYFDFRYNGEPIPLFDPLAPEFGPDRRRVLAYPSFLKRLEGVEMQSLWHQAARALESAGTVKFVGCSLPESDLAIRVLLGPLRFRMERGEVSVTARNPDGEVLDRWRTFLGDRIKLDKRPL